MTGLLISDDIGEGTLGALEEGESDSEEERSDDGACEDEEGVEGVFGEECPAHALDGADHGVQGVDGLPLGRDGAQGVCDGGCEEPHLHEKGHGLRDIAVADVYGGESESDAEDADGCEGDPEWQREDVPGWGGLVPDEEYGVHEQCAEEVHGCCDEAGDGEHESGEVDFSEECGV